MLYRLIRLYNVSKVAFIILSPSTIEASHPGLMRQFELYAIITSTYSTYVHCCMPSKWWVVSVHLIPRQASQRLSMARYATGTATKIHTQRDSNPVLTSTSQQVAGTQFSIATIQLGYHYVIVLRNCRSTYPQPYPFV